MSWPHPVIRIMAKIAYCCRWSTNQSNISISLCYKLEILIGFKKGPGKGTLISLFFGACIDLPDIPVHYTLSFRLLHIGCHATKYCFGNIFYSYNKGYIQSGVGQLFSIVHSPKPVADIIMVQRGMILNGIKSAVVIGQNQAF